MSLHLKNIPAKYTIGDQIIYSHYPSMPRFLHFSVPTARPSQPRFYDTRRIFHPLPPVPCPHRSPEFTTDFVSTLLQPAAVQGGQQKQPREEVSDLPSLNQITERRTFPPWMTNSKIQAEGTIQDRSCPAANPPCPPLGILHPSQHPTQPPSCS